jgi:hypothetical protein
MDGNIDKRDASAGSAKGKGKRETGCFDRLSNRRSPKVKGMLRQAQQPENGDKWSNEGGIPFEDLGI